MAAGQPRQPQGPVLVTGSSGHLGEALLRALQDMGVPRCVGLDAVAGPHTTTVLTLGSDATALTELFRRHRFATVFHAATLHKPHIATHTKQQFIDANVTATHHLLEAARETGSVMEFVFTSSTTVYGHAIPRDAPPVVPVWIDETVAPIPRNIYGLTKFTAELLVELFAREQKAQPPPTVTRFTILRPSRFFLNLEPEDSALKRREVISEVNLKVAELLYRRADLSDVTQAHLLAATAPRRNAAAELSRTYIISAPPPFSRQELEESWVAGPEGARMRQLVQGLDPTEALGWALPDVMFDRVYDSSKARTELGWAPAFTFANAVAKARQLLDEITRDAVSYTDVCSDMHTTVGAKPYHATDRCRTQQIKPRNSS